MSLNENVIVESLRQWGIGKAKLDEVQRKIKTAKEELLSSIATVYCETCGLMFYSGEARKIMNAERIITDFRMLAFRHAWDNQDHNVVVEIIIGKIDYSPNVNNFRQRLISKGDPRQYRTSDQNWNPRADRVACSTCGRLFNNIKEACSCCSETKPFLFLEGLERFGLP